MKEFAIKVLGVVFAILVGVWSYGYLNELVFAILALLGAIAIGVIIYFITVKLLAELLDGV